MKTFTFIDHQLDDEFTSLFQQQQKLTTAITKEASRNFLGEPGTPIFDPADKRVETFAQTFRGKFAEA